ncbi:MAG: GNAT family N-acetyltransferase [Candidatus Thorarchaeota archaeon]
MVLRSIAHNDPQLEQYKEKIQWYTKQVEPLGFTYQLYLNEDQPVGIALIGQEPMQLFKPIGTPLIRLIVIDYAQSEETLNELADELLHLAKLRDVDFAYLDILAKQEGLSEHLKQIGFQELANRYEMIRPLKDSVKASDQLRYEQIRREDVNQFFVHMKEFMSGSPDVVLNMVIENMKNVPEEKLDYWYQSDQAYFVYHEKELIGILDLVPPAGYIQNIGVAPVHRRKGFATEMLRFCLQLLRSAGSEKAKLGVHVDNEGAIRLYESLGFKVDEQVQTFIWWNTS